MLVLLIYVNNLFLLMSLTFHCKLGLHLLATSLCHECVSTVSSDLCSSDMICSNRKSFEAELNRNHQSIFSRAAKPEVKRFKLLIAFVHHILVGARYWYCSILSSYGSRTVTWFSHMQLYLIYLSLSFSPNQHRRDSRKFQSTKLASQGAWSPLCARRQATPSRGSAGTRRARRSTRSA